MTLGGQFREVALGNCESQLAEKIQGHNEYSVGVCDVISKDAIYLLIKIHTDE